VGGAERTVAAAGASIEVVSDEFGAGVGRASPLSARALVSAPVVVTQKSLRVAGALEEGREVRLHIAAGICARLCQGAHRVVDLSHRWARPKVEEVAWSTEDLAALTCHEQLEGKAGVEQLEGKAARLPARAKGSSTVGSTRSGTGRSCQPWAAMSGIPVLRASPRLRSTSPSAESQSEASSVLTSPSPAMGMGRPIPTLPTGLIRFLNWIVSLAELLAHKETMDL